MARKLFLAAFVIDDGNHLPKPERRADPTPPTSTDRASPGASSNSATFRSELSPSMRDGLAFEYYEVRPCIERDNQVTSYRDERQFDDELARARSSANEIRTFWSLYGIGSGTATAIGDFVSKDAAHEVMNAILAIPAAVLSAINVNNPVWLEDIYDVEDHVSDAAAWIGDMINQSSNGQRI